MHNTEALFALYRPFAERIAMSYRNIPGVSDDERISIALEALHRATQSYDSSRGTFEPWAGTIIRNALNSLYEREKRYADRFVTETDAAMIEDGVISTGPLAEAKSDDDVVFESMKREARAVVFPRLASLSERARRYVELYAQGHSISEISRILDVSKQAVSKSTTQSFADLQEKLKEDGFPGLDSSSGMLAASERNGTK
jgi:RNA polymerase sigma factor (sigma-70 family)